MRYIYIKNCNENLLRIIKRKKRKKIQCNGKVKFESVLIVVDKVVLKF